tara:strand:+ start:2079 stop:2345 length:267 start_codon:yes stop_codon:yes gene_type:complete
MSTNKKLEKLCYNTLLEGGKRKKEINIEVVDTIVKGLDIPFEVRELLYGLNNLGFRLEKLKERGVKNTAKCKDANEGLVSPAGTWYIS